MAETNDSISYRDIPDFPGYCVGNDGTVWTMRNLGRHKNDSNRRPLKGGTMKYGHRYVNLTNGTKKKTLLVHRLVLELFVGPCPEGMVCCHCDGDASNNAVGNLRWDTQKSNVADSIRHGTHIRGERCGSAKLTKEDVIEAKRLHALGGWSFSQLGRKFGVSVTAIWQAVRGERWAHLV